MPSSTLTLYKNSTQTTAFLLVSTSENSAKWIAAGRALSVPLQITQTIKPNKGVGNDTVEIVCSRVEANATTGKLATCLFKGTLSIPKDQTVLTPTIQNEIIGLVTSFLNEATALEATSVNRTALIEGRIA